VLEHRKLSPCSLQTQTRHGECMKRKETNNCSKIVQFLHGDSKIQPTCINIESIYPIYRIEIHNSLVLVHNLLRSKGVHAHTHHTHISIVSISVSISPPCSLPPLYLFSPLSLPHTIPPLPSLSLSLSADEEVPDLVLDLSLPKKKKKKKKKKTSSSTAATTAAATTDVDPDAKLGDAVAGDDVAVDGDDATETTNNEAPWAGSDRDYAYTELLDRIFKLLRENNPNLAVRKRHVMPPPQIVRVGTRKTMWANFSQICTLMHRQEEHVMNYILAELGTDGSVDGNHRLIVKGRFIPKQIESLLKKYIVEYVTCHMCRNPETTLTRDSVTRLYFLQCESCGSRRSVAPIKSGFHATNRMDRRRARQ
jgi:translation initiation factor 2 subunit 2